MPTNKQRSVDTMKQQTLDATIAALRKERGMTQLQLANQMGVTDKAVSKWERDLSFPDAASLPKLAETLGVSVDELMQGGPAEPAPGQAPAAEAARLVPLILCGVALAMGVAVAVVFSLRHLCAGAAFPLARLSFASLAAGRLR